MKVKKESKSTGMPWEAAYGLATNNLADAALDSDGDGMSNGQEYAAGTDPTNSLSYLKIDSLTAAGGATIAFGVISNSSSSCSYGSKCQFRRITLRYNRER